jgi:probable phosphoglycerate mutase
MPIFLIRHAETDANAALVVQTPETPLSERGHAQAERLARRLAGEGVASILSSDLARAATTAERVRAATGAALAFDPLLQERNFGAIRGMPYAEVGADIFAPGYAPPGGESWEAFHARVDRAWDRIREVAAEVEGNLAVVTHGLVCYSLVLRHVGQPRAEAPPLRFGNTAVTVVDGGPPWGVSLLNCTVHLEKSTGEM